MTCGMSSFQFVNECITKKGITNAAGKAVKSIFKKRERNQLGANNNMSATGKINPGKYNRPF